MQEGVRHAQPPGISQLWVKELVSTLASLGGCLHSLKTRARWVEGLHDELHCHVCDLEWDGLLQVVLCPESPRHTATASPKPSLRAPCKVGNAMVSRGKAAWTTSKSEHPCPHHNCSHWPPAEKTGKGSMLNCPSSLPNNPISHRTELTCTEHSHKYYVDHSFSSY